MLQLLTAQQQEEYQVNKHYSKLLFLATKLGDDTTFLKQAQAAKLKEIDDKYRKEQEDKDAKTLEEKKKLDEEYQKYLNEQFEKIKKLDQERQDTQFAINQAIGQSWVNLGSTIAGTIGSLINVFEEGSALAKAFGVAQVAISTASSIGSILLSGQQQQSEYNKALAAGNALLGLGAANVIAGNFVLGGKQLAGAKVAIGAATTGKALTKANTTAQIAAAGVAGATQIAAILSAKKSSAAPSVGGGGGGGGAVSIPAPSIAGIAAPVIQGTQPMNTGTQIAQTLSQATNKPVEAYVISGKVSSQQALDRRTSAAATFG
jgi:hypothetical protein